MIAAITSSGSVAVNCGAKVMVLTPFQGRVALPSALHFQLPSGCHECDAAVSHPADSPPVSLLTPDFPRRTEGTVCTRPRARQLRPSPSLNDISAIGEINSFCSWLPAGSRFGSHGETYIRKLVGRTGFEPVTSSVSGKRSPAELTARVHRRDATRAEPLKRAANRTRPAQATPPARRAARTTSATRCPRTA